jgi:hypothetical protein
VLCVARGGRREWPSGLHRALAHTIMPAQRHPGEASYERALHARITARPSLPLR